MPEHLPLPAGAAEQLVDQPVGQPLPHLGRQLADRQTRPEAIERVLDQLLRELAPGRQTPRDGRAAGISLRSPPGLAPLNAGVAQLF